jgi:uncharacterized protein (DUF1015 family)
MSVTAKLRLRPFAAMRFNPGLVGDVGQVTSPPYDVMDRPMIDALLSDHPQNIVRLVLPRMVSDPVRSADPYARAASLLARWRDQGIVVTDAEPALYVYEYGDASGRVCGVVGALELRTPDTHVVLPHEGVIPDIVADRLAMMAASRANLEPILLVYDGAGSTREVLEQARSGDPLTDVCSSDGTHHRLWALDDPAEIRSIRQALAPHQALIADGHHRYASYLQLRRRHRSVGDGAGPWDRGLAMLIDQSQYPLRLAAIHRSVSELRLDAVQSAAGFDVGPLERCSAGPPPPSQRGRFVVSDSRQYTVVSLTRPRDGAVSDAELLHTRLLPAWGVGEDRVGYHHTVTQALRNATQDAGLAVLLHPATVDEVMEVARAGEMMPRKSTSFGPKPRTGLVMRSFDDET